VDLFTRLIDDPRVSEDYAVPVEEVSDRFRIIRIQCGGRRYMRKELLWPHLDEFADKTIKFIKSQNQLPDIVHGHYPDAGYVAMQLAHFFGTPFFYTGHSLGRSKLQKLLADGMKHSEHPEKVQDRPPHRRGGEHPGHADGHHQHPPGASRSNTVRTSTTTCRTTSVIPPGIDIEKFYPSYRQARREQSLRERPVRAGLHAQGPEPLFLNPDKPLILALCRPDKRKNISGLIQAYGKDLELQAMANLAIFAGIRKDIDTMEDNERDVLTHMLLLMDKYDLYGRKWPFPRGTTSSTRSPPCTGSPPKPGVFVNPALTEPFGLTLLEASATGCPSWPPTTAAPTTSCATAKTASWSIPPTPAAIAAAIKNHRRPGKWEPAPKTAS
jgi:sucrose-phosphate synthase